MKICFTKTNPSKNKRTKKKKTKSFQRRESNPGPPTWKFNVLSRAAQRPILESFVKLIIFNTFAYEILPVDAV